MDEREFPIPPWFLFCDLFSHGLPPKISHYRRKATGSPSEESTLLRNISSILGKQEALQPAQEAKSPAKIRNATPHPRVPSLMSKFRTLSRLKKTRNTNQYEVTSIPVTEPLAAPLPDAFLRFDAEASTVLQECEDFLEGEVPFDYVMSLLSHYFKDNSWRQGEIGIFVEPLDDLYRMQTAYKDISTKALDVDGPSNCHKKMECAGETIRQLILWLEDIWHAGIDGPYGLHIAYNNCRLRWQREAKMYKFAMQ
ncbi:hypothetical protein F5146DRAFT_1007290 [Armillaria mellea]|nr:hypothetical protein F5146DRAFT_1007290 [Armillaria mellea]